MRCNRTYSIFMILVVLAFLIAQSLSAQTVTIPVVTTRPPVITPPNSTFDHFHLNVTELFYRIGQFLKHPPSLTTSTSTSTTSATSTVITAASTSTTSTSSIPTTSVPTTTVFPLITPPNSTFDSFHLNLTELWKRFSGLFKSSTTTSVSTSIASTTVASSTTTSSTTTIKQVGSRILLPKPNDSSQLVVQGGSTNVTVGMPTGGVPPFSYQWLGSYTNMSGSYLVSVGDALCGDSADTQICTFQTTSAYMTLDPGTYYLKLHVNDSAQDMANSSILTVSVIRSRAGVNSSQAGNTSSEG